MTDEQFREQYRPLRVPAAYNNHLAMRDKVIFALADLGEGTAVQVSRRLGELEGEAAPKTLAAAAQQILAELYRKGFLAGNEEEGSLVYNLHKITQANGGSTDPGANSKSLPDKHR